MLCTCTVWPEICIYQSWANTFIGPFIVALRASIIVQYKHGIIVWHVLDTRAGWMVLMCMCTLHHVTRVLPSAWGGLVHHWIYLFEAQPQYIKIASFYCTTYCYKYMFTLRKCNICGLIYISKNKVDAAFYSKQWSPHCFKVPARKIKVSTCLFFPLLKNL